MRGTILGITLTAALIMLMAQSSGAAGKDGVAPKGLKLYMKGDAEGGKGCSTIPRAMPDVPNAMQ